MNRVAVAVMILLLIAAITVLNGCAVGGAVTELRALLAAERVDAAAVRKQWDDVSYIMEMTVIREDLDAVEEDLCLLSGQEENDPERKETVRRLDRTLRHIQDGFVPSFSGIF